MPTPARTSREAIVAAARGILEQEGLDRLTMQRVAAVVGVRPPSLYKRVRDRGELVRLLTEDVAAELSGTLEMATRAGDPRADLRALAHAVRTFARWRPHAYGLLFTSLPDSWRPDPELLAGVSAPVLRTTAALVGDERALDAARTVVAWMHGFLSMELAGAFRLGGDVDRAFGFGIDRLVSALDERAPSPSP